MAIFSPGEKHRWWSHYLPSKLHFKERSMPHFLKLIPWLLLCPGNVAVLNYKWLSVTEVWLELYLELWAYFQAMLTALCATGNSFVTVFCFRTVFVDVPGRIWEPRTDHQDFYYIRLLPQCKSRGKFRWLRGLDHLHLVFLHYVVSILLVAEVDISIQWLIGMAQIADHHSK